MAPFMKGEMVDPAFKQVPEGWVFRAPGLIAPLPHGATFHNPWSSRSYLVTDAQKPDVAAVMQRAAKRLLGTMVVAMVAAAGIYAATVALLPFAETGDLRTGAFSFAVGWMLLSVILFVLIAAFWMGGLRRDMQAALAGAQETTERVTLHDQFRTAARTTAIGWIVGYVVFGSMMVVFDTCTIATLLPMKSGAAIGDWSYLILTIFGIVMFGAMAAIGIAMLVARLLHGRQSA